MESINVIFDIVLIVFSLWMGYMIRKSIGGLIGNAILLMNLGIIILALAPISETIMSEISTFSDITQGLIYRAILLLGFLFLLTGFAKIRRLSSPAV